MIRVFAKNCHKTYGTIGLSKFLLQEQIIDSFISENYFVIQATGKKSPACPGVMDTEDFAKEKKRRN